LGDDGQSIFSVQVEAFDLTLSDGGNRVGSGMAGFELNLSKADARHAAGQRLRQNDGQPSLLQRRRKADWGRGNYIASRGWTICLHPQALTHLYSDKG